VAITDIRPMQAVQDVRVALALLTRLPLPHPPFDAASPRPMARAAWAYPLVGVVLAGITGALAWVLHEGANLPAGIAAALVLLALILLTGAMHEDGLADCADGFWGAWQVPRRLEIMKDSQIGTYGTIALVLSLLLRWYCLTVVFDFGLFFLPLLAAALWSRVGMVCLMQLLPNARAGGLSHSTGRPGWPATYVACGVGLGVSWVVLGTWLTAIFAAATLAACALCGLLAQRKIGGQTGDVLGATQQVVEITVLVTAVAMLPT